MTRRRALFSLIALLLASPVGAQEEWLDVLRTGIASPYSQTRRDALKQVDANSAKGLKALWTVLDKKSKDPLVYDWYVREGAVEALADVTSAEAISEVENLLGVEKATSKNPLSKEAVLYSVIHRLRKDFIDEKADDPEYGENEDRRREAAKQQIRRTRGLEYFKLMLPRVEKYDPEGRLYRWIEVGLADADQRVRMAALNALQIYPRDSSIPLLIARLEAMKALEKKSKRNLVVNYREWMLTRFTLEQLSGQFYGDEVEDWKRWWTVAKDQFSLSKRVAEESEKGGARTGVARIGGIEVGVNMKVAGVDGGYPLLVLPWRGYEPDYFRPNFHGLEDVLKVYYLYMPEIGDFKGLARGSESNIINYPTELLADALGEYMKETGLDEFAILAHGPDAGALAMYLLQKHGTKVSHIVFINPRSAGDRYGMALESVKREGRKRGNQEVVKGVDNLFVDTKGKPNYEPADDAESGGLHRAIQNLRYADPTSPDIATMANVFRLPGGAQVMNDNSWSCQKIFGGDAPKLPVLVCHGSLSPWSPAGDVQAVAKFFGAKVSTFAQSGEEPFLSETFLFIREVRNFFKSVLPGKDD